MTRTETQRKAAVVGLGLLAAGLVVGVQVGREQPPGLELAPRAVAQVTGYSQTFPGAPATPRPYAAVSDFGVAVHTQAGYEWDKPPDGLQGSHGAGCTAPPAQHPVLTYADSVYQCNDHIMTALWATQYGVTYLMPPVEVDFTDGPATVRVDVSTERTSLRDWWDLWVSPYDDHLVLPLDSWLPDGNGPPRRAVHARMGVTDAGHSATGNGSMFLTETVAGFVATDHSTNTMLAMENALTPSAAVRTTFELTISRDYLRWGMPATGTWWMDGPIPALDWTRGVVQIGHHSYNPTKDCPAPPLTCYPTTWHWDNVIVNPSLPLTLVKTSPERLAPDLGNTWTLASPAPAGAMLQFTGMGNAYEVSYNGGSTWQPAQLQAASLPDPARFQSYWQSIPAGTTAVQVRATGGWWADWWHARDALVLAQVVDPQRPRTPTPAATVTPAPSVTPGPTATEQPSPTLPPTLAPTATPEGPQPSPTATTNCWLVVNNGGQLTVYPQAPASCPQG